MNSYKTIRQTAATGILPEYTLRSLVKAKKCPGFYVWNRFMVNCDGLSQMLREMSKIENQGEIEPLRSYNHEHKTEATHD